MPEDDNKLHEGQDGKIQEIADEISENLTGENEANENPEVTETETTGENSDDGGQESDPTPDPTPDPDSETTEEEEVLGKKLTPKEIEDIRQYLKKAPKSQEEAFKTIEEMVKLCIANQGCVISNGLFEYNTWEAISKNLLWWCDKATRFNVSYPLEIMLVGYLIDNKSVIGY